MSSSIQAAFGAGTLYSIPTDTYPTPIKFGIMQDVTLDFSFETKQLYGAKQFALKLARGKAKATWKAKVAQLDANAINTLFLNGTLTDGSQDLTSMDEAHSLPGSPVGPAPTVTVTHAADFIGNILVDKSDVPLYPVTAGSESTDHYSFTDDGVFTFAAGNAGDALAFTYLYHKAVTNEDHTVPSTPFHVDATNAANFESNTSVKYAGSLNVLLCVESGDEAAGKYSFNSTTGEYTFAAADEGADILISYVYRATATDEAHTVPTPTSYTVQVTHHADFLEDLGVMTYGGIPLIRVAGGTEVEGTYSVDTGTGIYTFSSADAGNTYLFSYSYSSSTGSKITINNNYMGDTPYFEVVFTTVFEGNTYQLHMLKSAMDKWNFPTKLDDFTIPEASGEFFANDAGVIGYMSLS